MMRVLVTGGTGILGRKLIYELVDSGYTVRILGRNSQPPASFAGLEWTQCDLQTGDGLAKAVEGVDTIIHAATGGFRHSRTIDIFGTERLLKAARTANVSHFIYPSVVGVERLPLNYYQHKLTAELIIEQSAVPWTIARFTQFHEHVDVLLNRAFHMPVAVLPLDFRFQPIDAGEVAKYLTRCVAVEPLGYTDDMGGPQVLTVDELAAIWLLAQGMSRPTINFPLRGKIADAFRRGYNTALQRRFGKITWTNWVNARYNVQYSSQRPYFVAPAEAYDYSS